MVTQQSPAIVLKSIFESDLSEDDLRRKDKNELVALAKEYQDTISKLESDLEQCKANDGHPKGIISTSSNTLNMRLEASLESEIVLKIPTGSLVSILYYDDRELLLDGAMGQWCKVKYADKEGWVWGNYVDRTPL